MNENQKMVLVHSTQLIETVFEYQFDLPTIIIFAILPCNYIYYLATESHFNYSMIISRLSDEISVNSQPSQTIQYGESQFHRIIELYCINEVFRLLENSPIAKLRTSKVLVSFVSQFPIINLERLDISLAILNDFTRR